MCQNGIDLHGLMIAVEQLAGRGALLKKDIEAWADYLSEQDVPEAALELGKAIEALESAAQHFSNVQHQLEHRHDHGHDHHITATHFE